MPDQHGENDPTIAAEEPLYLRVFPRADLLVQDHAGYRPASGCFRSQEALSVDLASLSTPEETRDRDKSHPYHIAAFTAGVARAEGCRVTRDPLPENPAHALVYGDHQKGAGALTKGQAKKIAQQARIILLNEGALFINDGQDLNN